MRGTRMSVRVDDHHERSRQSFEGVSRLALVGVRPHVIRRDRNGVPNARLEGGRASRKADPARERRRSEISEDPCTWYDESFYARIGGYWCRAHVSFGNTRRLALVVGPITLASTPVGGKLWR